MSSLDYFYIQQWKKDEENRNDRRDLVYPDDDRFTIHGNVPIIEENDELEEI